MATILHDCFVLSLAWCRKYRGHHEQKGSPKEPYSARRHRRTKFEPLQPALALICPSGASANCGESFTACGNRTDCHGAIERAEVG